MEDIFAALKRNAVEDYRLDGEFIRAEATGLAAGAPTRQCGKDFVLGSASCVLRILTNKKPVWQSKLSAAAAATAAAPTAAAAAAAASGGAAAASATAGASDGASGASGGASGASGGASGATAAKSGAPDAS